MPLEVGIIGAGIAGLSAAVALTRAGHNVVVYEKSQFKNETGAAIMIGPNGTRILRTWGFDFDAAGALDYNQMRRVHAETAQLDSKEVFESVKEKYGERWLLFHRADLHSGLRQLVEGKAKVELGRAVKDVDVEQGRIEFEDGEEAKVDLVVCADGAHSSLIEKIIGKPYPVIKSPMSMYRFLQPMDKILSHAEAGKFYEGEPSGLTTFYKAEVGRPGVLLNTYPCRGGKLLYGALLHPASQEERQLDGWTSKASVDDVLKHAKSFHPAVQAICEGIEDVRVYCNMWRDPVANFTKGKAILIGDAGHLMLPTHGQGASMALEDAMALEVLLKDASEPGCVQKRARAFDELRVPRVSAVQTMSNKMMGPPEKMISEVKRYYQGDIPAATAKTFSQDYNDFFFNYKIEDEASKFVE